MPNWDSDFEAVLRRVIPPDNHELIDPEAELTGIGLDSMARMQLVILLEDVYDVSFPVEYLTTDALATPNSLWSALTAVRAGSGSAA